MNSPWYDVQTIAEGIWAIRENSSDGNLFYLVTGEEKALLIDAGWGIGDLAGLVKSLTSLPVTVVLTHGHPDHIFGGMQFPEVYLAEEDLPWFANNFSRKWRERFATELANDPLPPDFSAKRWINAKTPGVLSLHSGSQFNLGGRIIEVLALPGHSPGSVVLFDDRDRFLFSGDSILQGAIWMHLDHSLPLGEYWKNLCGLNQQSERFKRILPGHAETPIDKEVITEFIEGIAGILEGKRKGEPFHTFVGDGMRCWFKTCGVIYDQERL